MARSGMLRTTETRAITKLIGECRGLGDDVVTWRKHFFQELGRLVHAPVVVGGEQTGYARGRPDDLGHTDFGFELGFDRTGWDYAVARSVKNPETAVLFSALVRTKPPEDWVMIPTSDILSDDEWHGSEDYNTTLRVIGTDAVVFCFEPIPGTAGNDVSGVILMRAVGEPDFTRRDRLVIREAHAALATQIGGPLARFAEPTPAALGLRSRQVLRCLLEGDTDKQVGLRLGLTRNGVNEHAKRIFRHFGVTSRPELLARWVKRGWGSRFAWADDTR